MYDRASEQDESPLHNLRWRNYVLPRGTPGFKSVKHIPFYVHDCLSQFASYASSLATGSKWLGAITHKEQPSIIYGNEKVCVRSSPCQLICLPEK